MKIEFQIIHGKIAITPCIMVGRKEAGLLWLCFLLYAEWGEKRLKK